MTETEARRQRSRAYVRKHRYGVTEEQYNEMLEAQDHSCAVCSIEFSDSIKANIDHDHNCCKGAKSCGKCLRGLLCSNCLTLASLVETRFGYMDEMFTYLTHYLTSERRNN